jgi:hypothetical protein
MRCLSPLDGDHAFLADLLHGLGDLLANLRVAIGGDGADLGDFRVVGDRLGPRLQILDHANDGHVDAALQVHGVHARRNRLHAFANDRLGEDRRGRRAIAGVVMGPGGHGAQQLCAHILELVLQFDLLGDRNTVLGDARRAIAFVDEHVAAFRPQGDADGVGENINAAGNALTGVAGEFDVLGGHKRASLYSGCAWYRANAMVRARSADGGENIAVLHDKKICAHGP